MHRLTGIRPRWCGTPPTRLEGPDVSVQLRAHGDEHRAVVTVDRDDAVEVELLDPAYGIAPGQAAVDLRRHPGGRVGDDREHSRGPLRLTSA